MLTVNTLHILVCHSKMLPMGCPASKEPLVNTGMKASLQEKENVFLCVPPEDPARHDLLIQSFTHPPTQTR